MFIVITRSQGAKKSLLLKIQILRVIFFDEVRNKISTCNLNIENLKFTNL